MSRNIKSLIKVLIIEEVKISLKHFSYFLQTFRIIQKKKKKTNKQNRPPVSQSRPLYLNRNSGHRTEVRRYSNGLRYLKNRQSQRFVILVPGSSSTSSLPRDFDTSLTGPGGRHEGRNDGHTRICSRNWRDSKTFYSYCMYIVFLMILSNAMYKPYYRSCVIQ